MLRREQSRTSYRGLGRRLGSYRGPANLARDRDGRHPLRVVLTLVLQHHLRESVSGNAGAVQCVWPMEAERGIIGSRQWARCPVRGSSAGGSQLP